jgi:glycosyltransferase involved in cell wall biosynthesis
MDLPMVSVLMTSFNREKYIGEAIESVLASTYKNFELIIVDDVSTDDTIVIAEKYAKQDDRIRVFKNDQNLGDYKNRNKAASYATGKYLKYLDSDDLIYPWGLESMVYCMDKYPHAGYGLVSYGLKRNQPFPILLSPAEAYYSFYFEGSMIITGPTGAIIKREVFEKENGFSGNPYIGDTEMWLKLSANYSMVAMPLDTVWWRQHDNQQFKEGNTNSYYELNNYKMYIDALSSSNCPFTMANKENAIRNVKNRFARNVLIALAKGKFKKALLLYKTYEFSLLDILKCLRFNKYPTKLNVV